ncbi:MAG: tyrosine-type recombinase/integrase [Planctomycetes bacterium]|nr:tyrosine-type recombinase/integrase [Planctomycetota bacterium]
MAGRLRGPWSRSPDQGRGSPPELAGASLVCEEIPGGEGRLGPLRPGVEPPFRLGDRARAAMRLRPMSPSTEDAYLPWRRRYFEFRYGSGLGLLERRRLRVKDVDFGRNQITVRRGKGDEDRVTMLPGALRDDLAAHLRQVRGQHERDVTQGAGWVEPHGAIDRKLPSAARDWAWLCVFPATRTYVDPETGQRRRHHVHETVVQHAARRAVPAAGISKRATCPTFRPSFATHLHEDGSDIRTVRELLRHEDVATTIHTHVLDPGPGAVRRPADRLFREGPREGGRRSATPPPGNPASASIPPGVSAKAGLPGAADVEPGPDANPCRIQSLVARAGAGACVRQAAGAAFGGRTRVCPIHVGGPA